MKLKLKNIMNKLEFTNRNLENLNRCIADNGKVELIKFNELSNRLFDSFNNTNDNLIVIEEIDENNESTIIGVSDSVDKSVKMMQYYYGDYDLIKETYVRDSGIEYVYKIKVDNDICTVVLRYFNLNMI